MLRRSLLLASLLFAASTAAFSSGVSSQSFNQTTGCNSCHNNPGALPAPTVTLTPSSASATPGQALTLTFVIDNPTQAAAGLNLRASAGTLTQIDPATQMTGAELTHQLNGKAPTNGTVTFTASWTAPGTPGNVTFTAWGNSVNLNGTTSGDRAASATTAVTVETCVPTAEVCDGLDNNCNGIVDDMALCPAGQTCVNASCVALDGGTADAGTAQDAGTQPDGGAGGGNGGVIPGGGPSGGGGSADEDGQGCGCSGVGGGTLALFGMFALLLRSRRRAD